MTCRKKNKHHIVEHYWELLLIRIFFIQKYDNGYFLKS